MHANPSRGRTRIKPYLDDIGEHLGPIVAHHEPAHRELLESRVVLVEPPHGLWDSVGGKAQYLDRLGRDLARVVSSGMDEYCLAFLPQPSMAGCVRGKDILRRKGVISPYPALTCAATSSLCRQWHGPSISRCWARFAAPFCPLLLPTLPPPPSTGVEHGWARLGEGHDHFITEAGLLIFPRIREPF